METRTFGGNILPRRDPRLRVRTGGLRRDERRLAPCTRDGHPLPGQRHSVLYPLLLGSTACSGSISQTQLGYQEGREGEKGRRGGRVRPGDESYMPSGTRRGQRLEQAKGLLQRGLDDPRPGRKGTRGDKIRSSRSLISPSSLSIFERPLPSIGLRLQAHPLFL